MRKDGFRSTIGNRQSTIGNLNNLPPRNPADQLPIRLQKVIGRQCLASGPFHRFENTVLDYAAKASNLKKNYLYVAVRIPVARPKNLLADLSSDRQLLHQFSMERCFQVFAVMDLSTRELPLEP